MERVNWLLSLNSSSQCHPFIILPPHYRFQVGSWPPPFLRLLLLWSLGSCWRAYEAASTSIKSVRSYTFFRVCRFLLHIPWFSQCFLGQGQTCLLSRLPTRTWSWTASTTAHVTATSRGWESVFWHFQFLDWSCWLATDNRSGLVQWHQRSIFAWSVWFLGLLSHRLNLRHGLRTIQCWVNPSRAWVWRTLLEGQKVC